MIVHILRFFVLCLLFTQSLQDVFWIEPPPDVPDFSSTYYEGDPFFISWNPLYNTTTYCDLWVTASDYATNPFSMFIQENINLGQSGNYTWTINIADSVLQQDSEYVLRFKPPATPRLFYDTNLPSYPSRGLLLLRKTATASSSSSSSSSSPSPSPSPSSSASSSTTSTSVPASSSAQSNSNRPGGLTSGEKTGIGVGVAIGILGTLSLGLLLFMRNKRRKSSRAELMVAPPVYEKDGGAMMLESGRAGQKGLPSELPVQSHAVELPGSESPE